MEFRARVGTARGEIIEADYAAENEARLRRELEEKGLYILSLQQRGGLGGLAGVPARRRRVSRQEFLVYNQELATLLKAGMALVPSLDILRQRVANPTFKAVLDDVYERVKAGSALSDAFAEQGDLFPAVYAASLMAGERSGNLDAVIRRYVAYEKVIGTVRRRTISALIYPAILVTLMLGLIAIIVLKVVPAFSGFYANFDRPLPVTTQVLVAASNVVIGNFWIIAAIAVAAIAGGVAALKKPANRERIQGAMLRLPWIGATLRKFATSQLARTLATLLGGGIPLVNALEITVRAMSNRAMARELNVVRVRVQEGHSFAGSLLERRMLPDVAVKMVEVGESTGALQEMLSSIADFYDEEIETEVSRFITVIEPALLIVMGIIIAVVVLALYLPIFDLSSVAGGT
jgi:type IV pilus assembly protein PilC